MDSALAGGFAPHPGNAGCGGAIHPRKRLRLTRLWALASNHVSKRFYVVKGFASRGLGGLF
jgi:hypothetical protein